MRILHLTIKKKWFDKMKAGRKTHEFRLVKPYWTKRLENREYDVVRLRNGYSPTSPIIAFEFAGLSRFTTKGVQLYVIHLGKPLPRY